MEIRKQGIIVPGILTGFCLAALLGCSSGKKSYAHPLVNGFTPAQIEVGGTVTINGLDFSDIQFVSFGGVPATSFQTINSSQITAVVPYNAISGTIMAENPGGVGYSSGTLVILPVITGIDPLSGPPGTQVTVKGSGFYNTTSLVIGTEVAGAPASSTFTYYDPNQLNVVVGANATTGSLMLTASGVSATGPEFTVNYGQPVITSLSITQAAVGASVVLTGSGFDAVESVTFAGGAAASFVVNSDSQITVTVPSSAASGVITVVNPVGQGISSQSLTVALMPTFTSVSPNPGAASTSIAITGTNLSDNAATVTVGGVAATITSSSGTSIVATLGATTTKGPLVLTVSGITLTEPFTVTN